MLGAPIDFRRWVDEHRDQLKPPVGNKVIWRDQDFICMVVGGPNRRSDYHYDEGAEFFYQLEGDLLLKVMDADGPRDITIAEGQIFLLPPRVPHSPQRFADTVGLVIERRRLPGERDGLMWFCERCHEKLYEEYFELTDIETQFPLVFEHFFSSPDHRTCGRCGWVHPLPERAGR